MPNPFIENRYFKPKIALDVETAYEHNLNAGLLPTAELGAKSLAGRIRDDTTEAKTNGPDYHLSVLDQLLNPETTEAFEASFAASKELFGRIDLTAPTPAQCTEYSVDIAALATAYEQMKADGLEPELVLSPELTVAQWQDVYVRLEIELRALDDVRLMDGGLIIEKEVKDHWEDIAVTAKGAHTTVRLDSTVYSESRPDWTIRLIPGTDRPNKLRVSHKLGDFSHPTISQYLTLQATHFQACREPVDHAGTYTWLSGRFRDIARFESPYATWDAHTGCIRVQALGEGVSYGALGSRFDPDVWSSYRFPHTW